jgi:hypothetical protein
MASMSTWSRRRGNRRWSTLWELITALLGIENAPFALRRRFGGWQIRSRAIVPIEEIARHTPIPLPLKIGMRRGRLKIRRFELSRTPASRWT